MTTAERKKGLLDEIAALKREKPEHWQRDVRQLCRVLYRLEHPDRVDLMWQHSHPAPRYGDAYHQRLGRMPQ